MMVRVVLNVIGHAREFFPGKASRHEISLPAPMKVRDILDYIGVKPELVMHVFSSGAARTKDYVPADGEELTLVSPPSGG